MRLRAPDADVPVALQSVFDPVQGALQAAAHGHHVARPVTHALVQQRWPIAIAVRAHGADIQRGSVDRAVVRQVPVQRQVGRTRVGRASVLVQDAAGLLFGAWVLADALQGGQAPNGDARDGRNVVQQVQGHSEAVAAKQTAEVTRPPCRSIEGGAHAKVLQTPNVSQLAQGADDMLQIERAGHDHLG